MADSSITITEGSDSGIDTRTEATNGNHRQVIVIGDPSTNAGIAPVDATAGVKVNLGSDNDVTITGDALTALQLIDDIVIAEDAQHSSGDSGVMALVVRNDTLAALAQTDGDYAPLQVNASGALFIDVANGGTLETLIDGLETVLGTIDADTSSLAGAVTGTEMQVDIVADGAGLLTSSDFAAAFGTAGSADSQVMSVQGIASMTPILVDATGQGDVPITLDGEEVVLGTGSNAIGKLAANSGVDIGDVDVTSLPAGASDTNYFSATITSADASSATQVKAKTADKKIYVTSLMISVGSAALEVQLQSDNGTPQVVMEEIFLAANGGIAMSSADKTVPLFVVNTNEDLDVITSDTGDVTVLVSGYVV